VRRADRVARWGLWLAGAAAASFYVAFIVRSGFTFGGQRYYSLADDAMVSMRYGRNLAHGHGLVWNAGEHVEGYSNLLWTLWMSALHTLPLPDATASVSVMVSGGLILLATVAVAWSVAGLLAPGRPLVAVAAAVLVGLCYPLVFWTLRGMETGLAALLLLLAVRLALQYRDDGRDRHVWVLALVLSAAVLTRDDLVVPALVVIAFVAGWAPRPRRAVAVVAGAVAATLAVHAVFRLGYYGDALPNTYYLKLSGIPLGARLHRGVVGLAFTGVTSLYAPVALALAALLAARGTRRFASAALLVAVFAGECAYSLYVGGDFAEDVRVANRFITTAAPALMVLAAVGIGELARVEGSGRQAAAAVTAVFGVAAVAQAAEWPSTRVLNFSLPVPDSSARVAIAAAGVAAAAWLVARDPPARNRQLTWATPATAVAIGLLALAAVDLAPGREWIRANAPDLPPVRAFTKEGVLLHRTTGPRIAIAMDAAGAIAYFSHRRGVDLLGKVDDVVARARPQPVPFEPGHDKWDLDHSIGRLRPDVVTGLGTAAPRDRCRMPDWGYTQIAADFWVRADARGLSKSRLAAGLLALGLGPPQNQVC
jgi:hypothetical protein